MANPKIKISVEVDKPKAQAAKKEIKSFGQLFKDFTVKVTKSKFALGTMFALLSTGLVKAIKDFAELDKNITNVVNLFGGTREEVKKLTGDVLDLSTKFPQTAHDMSKGLFDVVSAGVDAGDSIKFLAEATKLATAGATTTEASVKGMVAVMNAWGLEAREASDISDLFFASQIKGVTTVEKLASSMGTLLPIAKAAGMSLEEAFAAVATLTKAGISTEQSVTALKGALNALIAPQEKAQKLAEKYKVDLSLNAKAGRDFATVVREIEAAVGGNNEELKAFFPRMRGMTAVLSLAGERTSELEEITKFLEERYGKTEKAVTLFQEGTSAQLDILANNFKAFGRSAIGAIDPVVNSTISFTNKMFDFIRKAVKGEKWTAKKEDYYKLLGTRELEEAIKELHFSIMASQIQISTESNKGKKKLAEESLAIYKEELKNAEKVQEENSAKAEKKGEEERALELDNQKKALAKEQDAMLDHMEDLRRAWEAEAPKRLKVKQEIWAKEQEEMLKNMEEMRKAQEKHLGAMADLGGTFIDENGLNMQEGLQATTKYIIDTFKLDIAKGLSGIMGDTMAGFSTGVLADVVFMGVTSILTSIFGSRPIKTTAEYAEDAFDNMVKKTNRAISNIGKVRSEQERKADIIEDLVSTFGGETMVSDIKKREDISDDIKSLITTFEGDMSLNKLLEKQLKTIVSINKDERDLTESMVDRGLTDLSNFAKLETLLKKEPLSGEVSQEKIKSTIGKALGLESDNFEVIRMFNTLVESGLEFSNRMKSRGVYEYVAQKDDLVNAISGTREGISKGLKGNKEKLEQLSVESINNMSASLEVTKHNLEVEEEKAKIIEEGIKPTKEQQRLSDEVIEAEKQDLLKLALVRDVTTQDRIDSLNRLLANDLVLESEKKAMNADLLAQKARLRQEQEAEEDRQTKEDEKQAEKDADKEEKAREKELDNIEDVIGFLQDEKYSIEDRLRDRENAIAEAYMKYPMVSHSTELGKKLEEIDRSFGYKIMGDYIDFDRDKVKEPLVININAGAFMGTPADAQEFARLIDNELFKLGVRNERISN